MIPGVIKGGAPVFIVLISLAAAVNYITSISAAFSVTASIIISSVIASIIAAFACDEAQHQWNKTVHSRYLHSVSLIYAAERKLLIDFTDIVIWYIILININLLRTGWENE